MRRRTTFSGRASSRATGRSIRRRRCLTAQRELGDEDWHALLLLAHNNKATAFDRYSKYYLSTSGQLYWSDTHQMSTYLDDYHVRLDKQLGVKDRATEMITEIYVPRPALPSFMAEVASVFRKNGVPDRVRHGPADRAG